MKLNHCARTICLLTLSMLSLAIFLKNVSCQEELQWRTYINIEVFEDCSASWIIQRKALLKTDADENLFLQYYSETSSDEILNNVHSMVNRASLITGRTMQVVVEGNFTVSYTISISTFGKEGILQYQFNWLGFAEKIDNERIKIGDALSGEFDLSPDDVLTIIYPNLYVPVFVSPSPDKIEYDSRALTWLGIINFGMGEPTILLEKESYSWAQPIIDNATFLSTGILAVLTGMLGYLLGKRRFHRKEELKLKSEEETSLGVESDEEKVLRLLAAAGGRLHQSTITKQCRFSKSKTSGLLSAMEKKGLISRKKSGRGKIVTLTEKTSVNDR